MDVQTKSNNSPHTCAVCGDTATCYRLYGATTVCYSCRIFFRRAVKSKQDMKCIKSDNVFCSFDKLTRNKCRKCRYEKCLEIGMNPLLVDSCKQTKNNDQQQQSGSTVIVANNASSNQSIISLANISPKEILDDTQIEVPVDNSLAGCTRENLTQKYEQVFDNILLHPQGEYMKKLYEVDKYVIEQARGNKEKIAFSSNYITTYKTISDSIGIQFLRIFFPDFSINSLKKIASSTSKTLLGLMAGLDKCFCNESMLDQIGNFFPCSPAFLQFWKSTAPDIDQLKAIPMESLSMMTSPWAPNIEDEEFVADTFQRLSELISGDREVGKLLCLLSLFSPVNIHLSNEETFRLKQFQSKISMMVYNHVLAQENRDNTSALELVGKIGRIIEDVHKCGEILHEGVIYHDEEDNVEDIEAIDIVEL